MIIDCILDRKDGCLYDPKQFYADTLSYAMCKEDTAISAAMDNGTEADVKRELCAYVDRNSYNPEVKDYINSVDWIGGRGKSGRTGILTKSLKAEYRKRLDRIVKQYERGTVTLAEAVEYVMKYETVPDGLWNACYMSDPDFITETQKRYLIKVCNAKQ